MAESNQRGRVVRALKPLDGMAVENPAKPGTPDVNYIEGWLELKWLRRWPARPDTVVAVEHFTPKQRRWLRRRWDRGGSAWLLLQVGREWLLFTGRDAAEYVGRLTREGLYRVARARWTSGLRDEELRECLTRDWDNWNGSPVVSGS